MADSSAYGNAGQRGNDGNRQTVETAPRNIVAFDPLFGDDAVLQRDVPTRVWGTALPGASVIVEVLDERQPGYVRSEASVARAQTDDSGRWRAQLPAFPAGGPYMLRASVTDDQGLERHCESHDVLFGDVWVLGGQSNMQLWMDRVRALFPNELAEARDPSIRFLIVPIDTDFTGPRTRLQDGTWLVEGRDDIADVSAAGYFFAKHLRRTVDVPLGFVQAAIGGTPIETWLSEPYLRRLDLLDDDYDQWREPGYATASETAALDRIDRFIRDADQEDTGLREHWEDPAFDDEQWAFIRLDRTNPSVEPAFAEPGIFWFRKTVDVPRSAVGRPAEIRLGTVSDADTCYVNGKAVGSTSYRYPPRNYHIDAMPERLTIAMKVRINVGTDEVFTTGKRHIIAVDPVVPTRGDNEPPSVRENGEPVTVWPNGGAADDPGAVDVIDLDALRPWRYRRSVALDPIPGKVFPTRMPAGSYNAMIAPLSGLALTGVLWYQGETNASRDPNGYATKMIALIQCWRKVFDRADLPFLYAQLPNLALDAQGYDRVRDEQRLALALDHTAMIVTLDAGEDRDLHPLDKDTVGRRFAIAADAMVYGGDHESMGPLVSRADLDPQRGALVVRFTHCGGGLCLEGVHRVPFTLVDPDSATPIRSVYGTITSPSTVEIDLNGEAAAASAIGLPGKNAVLRYAWGDSVDPVLRNGFGLLASPFEIHPRV